jgi:uncharacterized protein (TIGR01777 family)
MNNSKKILIVGGSGFIGQYLFNYLTERGFHVSLLSRKRNENANYLEYFWDPSHGDIDPEALNEKDVIINLSGAGIAKQYWTGKRKEVIYRSRIDSTSFLIRSIISGNHVPSLFISTSAIGFYGNRPDELLNESSFPGSDFVSKVCLDWEAEVSKLYPYGTATAILRIGIVLGKEGGSLSKFVIPLKKGVNILFGNGEQIMSWIHIHDLANIYEQLILGRLKPAIYNAVSPNPIRQQNFNAAILRTLQKKAIKIKVPFTALRIFMGEMTSILVASQNIVPKNLLEHNFRFNYPDLHEALENLLAGK